MNQKKDKKLNKGWPRVVIGVMGILLIVCVVIIVSLKSKRGIIEKASQFYTSNAPKEVSFAPKEVSFAPKEVSFSEEGANEEEVNEEVSLRTIPPESWQEFLKIEGSGNKRSETFFIKGNQWRIDWTITVPSGVTIAEGESLPEIIISEGENKPIKKIVTHSEIDLSMPSEVDVMIFGSDYILQGSTEFYVEVKAKSEIKWEIKISTPFR